MKKYFSRFDYKYFIFIFLFVIICLEIFGRIYLVHVLQKSPNPKFQFDSYRIYSHIPGFREGDGKGDWIVINGQGFRRDAVVTKEKPEDTYRVFLLGGSAAHGISTAPPYPKVHIYMDETIDHYLEEELKKKYPDKKFEIINAAVTGYQVFQHTSYILSELLDYDPDLMIFVDGANDHYYSNPQYSYMNDNLYQFWKPRLRSPSLAGLMDYTLLWMSKFSGFARGIYSWRLNRDAATLAHYGIHNHGNFSELVKQHKLSSEIGFLRAVETNILILKANDVDAIICLQPMLVLRQIDQLSEQEKSFFRTNENVVNLYPYVVEYLNNLSLEHQIPFIDLNLVFNNDIYNGKQLLVDYCHFSPLGGKVVAAELFPIADSLYKKRAEIKK